MFTNAQKNFDTKELFRIEEMKSIYSALHEKHKVAVLPIETRSGKCKRHGWREVTLDKPIFTEFDLKNNIGIALGKNSGGIIDIDLDWTEASLLAEHYFPNEVSHWRVERHHPVTNSVLTRHYQVRCSDIEKKDKIDGPKSLLKEGEKAPVIEILSEGQQVMVAPSIHPDGNQLYWDKDNNPEFVELQKVSSEVILPIVNKIGAASILLRVYKNQRGSRNELCMHIAGAFFHAKWSVDDVEEFLIPVICEADDEEFDARITTIKETFGRGESGTNITGLPSLKKLIGEDVVSSLCDLLGLANSSSTDFKELKPFEKSKLNIPVFPLHALGDMGKPVSVLQTRLNIPIEIAAQSILGAVNAAIHGKYNAELYQGMSTPISLFLTALAHSGAGKTKAEQMAYKVVSDWEDLNNQNIIQSDPSIQGTLKMLEFSPYTQIKNGDASIIFGGYSMSKDQVSTTVGNLCELFSGTAVVKMRATQEQPLKLSNRRLSCNLAMQPEIAREQYMNKQFMAQGFHARTLTLYTLKQRKSRRQNGIYSVQDWSDYEARLKQLCDTPVNIDVNTGGLIFNIIGFTQDAKNFISQDVEDYFNDLINVFIDKDIESVLEPIYNRGTEHCIRLAANLAIYEGCTEIQLKHAENAFILVKHYIDHWKLIYDKFDHDQLNDLSVELLRSLQRRHIEKGQEIFTPSEISKSGPRDFRKNMDLVNECFSELIERGYVRKVVKGYELRTDI